ncbi:aminotransferase class V-fold PLP-dependent enzyme [Aquimarina sp. 2201CG1-2-11]|uniref:aminotransferase class V-fold PLP-dependent enzyme n=1 Tax=Aquimarina discodermiae TaxID=3231043 RepID=UPI003461DE8A
MKNLRKEFPVLNTYTYLNTAYSGLLYDSLLEHRQEHDLDFLIGGSKFRDDNVNLFNNLRDTIASLFGSSKSNVVLSPNFSIGLNTLLNGFKENQKILLLDEDYPSVNFAATNKSFEICYAQIDANLEQNVTQAIAHHQPNIFLFSLVQYTNGLLIDLGFLKEIKVKYPDMLIIADATQFCGTAPFNFDESGIDILGASGYKWLLGGYGNGFILFKDQVLVQTTPDSYVKSASESTYDTSYISLPARFESGHLDTFNFSSLHYSLQRISKIGLTTIEHQIKELTEYTKHELIKLELLDETVVKRKKHSSIFNLKGDQELYNYLKDHDIITALRGKGIRISMHFYNTIEDIETLLKALYKYHKL